MNEESGYNSGTDSQLINPQPKFASATKQLTSSLFGAVMKNSDSKSTTTAPADGVVHLLSANLDNDLPPQTPQNKAKNKASSSFPGFSPGGFQLFDFVNSVHSPFFQHRTNQGGDSPATTPAAAPTEQRPEWLEMTIPSSFSNNTSMNLVDWTLKSNLQFEFLPSIPSGSSWPIHHCSTRQAGRQSFLSSTTSSNLTTSLSSPAVLWETSLLQWQYPSPATSWCPPQHAHEMPTSTNNRRQHNSSTTATGRMAPPLKEVSRNHRHASKTDSRWRFSQDDEATISQFTNLRPPVSSKSIPSGPAKEERFVLSSIQRKKEWQSALQSLYQLWMLRIRDFSRQCENQEPVARSEVWDAYFYSIGKGHVILFRVAWTESDGDNDDHRLSGVEPEIVISSSSTTIRNLLRKRGVKLMLLDHWDGKEGNFHEDMLRPPATPVKTKDAQNNLDASPAVKAELLALRRAQALGQTVGADVSISIKTKTNAVPSISPKRIPPLVVIGWDDCAVFLEVYLNCCGNMHTPSTLKDTVHGTLPTLVSRSLGPFLHSSMERLSVTKKQSRQSKGDYLLEVEGMILPCAVRGLLSAAIGAVRTSCQSKSSDTEENQHRVLIRCSPHEGTAERYVEGAIGRHSSKGMNSDRATSVLHGSGNNISCGEYVSVATYDSDRPEVLSFKLSRDNDGLLS